MVFYRSMIKHHKVLNMEVSTSPSLPSSCLYHLMNDLWDYNIGIWGRKKHRCSDHTPVLALWVFHKLLTATPSPSVCQVAWPPVWECVLVACREAEEAAVCPLHASTPVEKLLPKYARAQFRRMLCRSHSRLPATQGSASSTSHTCAHCYGLGQLPKTALLYAAIQSSKLRCLLDLPLQHESSSVIRGGRGCLGVQVYCLLLGPRSDLCHFQCSLWPEKITYPSLTFKNGAKVTESMHHLGPSLFLFSFTFPSFTLRRDLSGLV